MVARAWRPSSASLRTSGSSSASRVSHTPLSPSRARALQGLGLGPENFQAVRRSSTLSSASDSRSRLAWPARGLGE